MRGRIFSVKKTTLLALSFAVCLWSFVAISLVLVLDKRRYDDCFFVFCTFVGLHFMFRAFLMKIDSTCYLGVTIFLVGVLYFYAQYMQILSLYPALILLAFAFGSYFTYVRYHQPFQFTMFLSLIFATFSLAFYILNVISLYIFLAFLLLCVLLLLCRYLLL